MSTITTDRAPAQYRLSWPLLAVIAAAFATLFVLNVTTPQVWLVAFIFAPLVIAPKQHETGGGS